MKNLKQILKDDCYGKDLDQRKSWYSPAAAAYFQVRPRYPQVLIDQVIERASLSKNSVLLEVGCGPAIATPAFANLSCRMVCIEPNPDFLELARSTCEPYPMVELQNCSFEEWDSESEKFDAVIAASSFHWIPPEIGYPKAAAALRPDGHLILLWNKELQPEFEVYQQMQAVYKIHAPALMRSYENSAEQVTILNQLGLMMIESGQFTEMVSNHLEVKVSYSVDQYLMLLNTYSPHLKLEPNQKEQLFAGLRQVLELKGERVLLSYISMFHIARPRPTAAC
jgi:SAM-dependent methyltransferase